MSPSRTCPECGAPLGRDALAGLCPRCLGRIALGQIPSNVPPAVTDEELLLRRAMEFLNPEAQRAFLIGACGDDQVLFQHILGRLQSLTANQPTLKDALGPMPQIEDRVIPITEKAGDRIGPYRLLQKVGEGGFGVVYVAEQTEPVQRRVALKVIKLGMDTRAVVARFEAERQALALMDHPHISKVLDAGATEAGRPYFVMELVKGVSITKYCDQHKLPTKERLKLFIQVCQAIQHAHQKGIIHRDIKPSNILVSEHDSGPVPKVIDFGIAKATDRKLTEKTLYTAMDQFIGTPAYVSPEQAEMSAMDVDTRTDIYSLGVLLYELLTGRTPFDTRLLLESGLDEMRRTIREKDPPQPSTRLTSLDKAEWEKVAGHHRSEPGKLRGLLRGDLDWITMKALEKDRNRRYDTANGLAMDIQRHFNNEPVTAAAPTTAYRLSKLVRRNKGVFAAVAAVLVVSLIGTGFSTWQAWRANQQAHQAEEARAETLVQLEAKRYEEGKVWMERAEGYLGEKNYFYAKLMAARAIGFEGVGRKNLPEGLQHDLPPLLPADSPEAQKARFLLHGANYALVWRSPTFSQHTNGVTDLAFSPNGELLASTSWDYSVRLWNVKSGLLIREFTADDQSWCVAFSPDGALLAAGYQRGAVQVWDLSKGSSRAVLKGDGGTVTGVAFNPAGDVVAAASFGGVIRLWDVKRGQTNANLTGPTGGVGRVVFTPDGRFLAAAFQSQADPKANSVQLWDVATGRLHRIFPGPEPVFSMALSPKGDLLATVALSPKGDLLATGDRAGTVRIWKVSDGTLKTKLEGHAKEVQALDFSPDGLRLISGSSDGSLVLSEVASGRSLAKYNQGGGEVYSAKFSKDGRVVASGHQDGRIRFLKIDGTEPAFKPKPQGHSSGLEYVGFSPDGRRLISADQGGNLLVWDLASGSVHAAVGDGIAGLEHAALDPSGRYVAAAFATGAIRVWDLTANAPLWEAMETHGLTEIAFTPDGQYLITGNINGKISLRSSSTGVLRGGFQAHPEAGFVHLAVSPDGFTLATGSEGHHNLRLWELPGGTLLHEFKGHTRDLSAVAFSPSGRYVASGSRDGTVLIWDVVRRQLHKELPGHVVGVWGLTFSPNESLLATADQAGALRLWDIATGQLQVRWQFSGVCRGIAFHPDLSLLALASNDGTVQMWELVNAHVEATLAGDTDAVRSLAFSRDGKELVSAGDKGRILTWDLTTGQINQEFFGDTNDVYTVALSPDQSTLAAGDRGGTLRLWDRSTGRRRAEFRGQTNALYSLSFNPDGTLLAAGSEDGTVRIWDLARGEIKFVMTAHGHAAVRAVAFSHDGARLMSADVGGGSFVWITDTGQRTNEWHNEFSVQSIASALASPLMAVGGTEGQIQLLSVAKGRLFTLPSHSFLVHSLAFSPDESLLTSGSDDGAIQISDTRKSALLAHITETSHATYAVAFSPDGKFVAAAGGDGVVRLYDVAFILRGSPDYASYMTSLKVDGRKVLSTIPQKQNNLYRREPVPMQSVSGRSILTVLRSGLTGDALDRKLFQRFLKAGNLPSASLALTQHGDGTWQREREALSRAYFRQAATAKGYGANRLAEQYEEKGRK